MALLAKERLFPSPVPSSEPLKLNTSSASPAIGTFHRARSCRAQCSPPPPPVRSRHGSLSARFGTSRLNGMDRLHECAETRTIGNVLDPCSLPSSYQQALEQQNVEMTRNDHKEQVQQHQKPSLGAAQTEENASAEMATLRVEECSLQGERTRNDHEEQVPRSGRHNLVLPTQLLEGNYARELEVAVRAVQLACILSQRTQERLLHNEEKVGSKIDRSLVTVADWGVQAVISWVLSQSFGSEEVSMVAEEDIDALKGMDGIHMLQRVVHAVNECLFSSLIVGLDLPKHPLGSMDVLKAINKGSSNGGPKGRHWILDPVDGTLGFVHGDQYAIALSMIEDGEVVLGVLGCPNFPLRREWLNYHHRYYRLISKLSPPSPNLWHKGCIFTAQRGGLAWIQPSIWGLKDPSALNLASPIHVSAIEDPEDATFCEPVEKANSNHTFTAGLASSLGLRKRPLRVYSMAKYGAIARGDVEIFMKFARSGYKEKIWDHAAGVLIVEAAGGVVSDAGGKPLDFSQGRFLEGLDRGIITCSGKKLHEKLVEAVNASWDSSLL